MIPTLTTPRLILRPYRLADFEPYAAMWAEPEVVRFIGGVPFTREAAWTRFLRQMGMWHHLGFGFFVVEARDTGAFIGEAGFHEVRRDLIPSIEGTLEAGWALVSAAQGKGLAEEAMRAALDWADAALASGRLDATCRDKARTVCMIEPAHGASLHVAGKLGYSPYTETTYHGRAVRLLERPRPEA
ncbi:GNAT family N-acetyltransferase [Ancylobacter terrae]|uniref:GNAT family N-acetyltransferase n=1 Tax=Ancylobacter sp. sgz301288 TaxID=3342077 RepID=UPI00385E76C1